MVESAKEKQAIDAFKKGKEALKTGLFKWSPNFDEGAMRFEKAAKLFKECGNNERALTAYLEYSKCAEKQNELLGAAEGLQ